MLVDLFIKDFVLIDKLFLEFNKGLSVLTGETGAGKSILLDALSLSCGARGDTSYIKKGAKQACVSASFRIAKNHNLLEILKQYDLLEEADEDFFVIHLRRHIQEKGTKAFVNDIPVKLSLLKTIGDELFEINGQFDHLFDAKKHIHFLDQFIDDKSFKDALNSIQELYKKRKIFTGKLEALDIEERKNKESEFLRKNIIDDLSGLDLIENEEDSLLKEREEIEEAGKFSSLLGELDDFFARSDFLNNIQGYLNKLERLGSEGCKEILDPLLKLESYALESHEQIKDNYLQLKSSQERLYDIDERLYLLRKFSKKYGVETNNLHDILHSAEIKSNRDYEADRKKIIDELKGLENQYVSFASKLTDYRKNAAQLLKKEIEKEFNFLKLPHALFEVSHKIRGMEESKPNGLDDIEFLISTNKGQDLSPIHKSASGGELSRVMLALKTILSTKNEISCLVFDEIETGVGGAVAMAIGQRMKKLSHSLQILSVSHSPQVASFADDHFFVKKSVLGEETKTDIRLLTREERTKEIARMLSAEEVTQNAFNAAQDLEKTAQKMICA